MIRDFISFIFRIYVFRDIVKIMATAHWPLFTFCVIYNERENAFTPSSSSTIYFL